MRKLITKKLLFTGVGLVVIGVFLLIGRPSTPQAVAQIQQDESIVASDPTPQPQRDGLDTTNVKTTNNLPKQQPISTPAPTPTPPIGQSPEPAPQPVTMVEAKHVNCADPSSSSPKTWKATMSTYSDGHSSLANESGELTTQSCIIKPGSW